MPEYNGVVMHQMHIYTRRAHTRANKKKKKKHIKIVNRVCFSYKFLSRQIKKIANFERETD